MKKCLIIGAVIADVVMNIHHVPQPGEDIKADCLAMCAGGCAYNVVCILQELGVPNTLCAPLGSGMYADFIRKKILERGIDAPILETETDNGYSLCLIDKKAERTFINIPGAEMRFRKEWFSQLNMEEYDTIYVSGYELEDENFDVILPFLEKYRDRRIYIAPGPSSFRIQRPFMERIYRLSPILHLNGIESLYLSGEDHYEQAAEHLFSLTGAPVIITAGKNGCFIKTKTEKRYVEGEAVEAVDTNGAGDSHIGTIIALRKKNYNLFEAARIANHVAAQVVQVSGPNLPLHRLQS